MIECNAILKVGTSDPYLGMGMIWLHTFDWPGHPGHGVGNNEPPMVQCASVNISGTKKARMDPDVEFSREADVNDVRIRPLR